MRNGGVRDMGRGMLGDNTLKGHDDNIDEGYEIVMKLGSDEMNEE